MNLALRTPRLRLREWRDADTAPFAALAADPLVMQYLPPLDPAGAQEWVRRARAHWRSEGFGQWVVELPGEADFIGVVGLNRVRWMLPFTPAVEIAWRIAHPYWRQGYALEAARAALDDAFLRLRLDEIVAYTVAANEPSWRLMERLGMRRRPAEDFDHPALPDRHPYRRHVLYRLRRGQR
ncbi:MAG: GNAT family N-acetyltransferase [Thiohalocapsa sp.]